MAHSKSITVVVRNKKTSETHTEVLPHDKDIAGQLKAVLPENEKYEYKILTPAIER